jgi:acetoin utilization deacetylase AcuC-like enzyme
MTIALISHPDCVLHDVGPHHPESPERVKVIEEALKVYPFKTATQFYQAPKATYEQLISVHDKDYVNWIMSIAPKEDYLSIDPDTVMNSHTLQAALRAAGSVPFAVDNVVSGKSQVAFCNVRPPGHHAEREKAMGFCFFNNVAIGASHALTHYPIERVAIIDFDVHHGNGTQNIFQHDKRVLYCSSFEHPLYPGYDSEMDNKHILSVPLPAGTGGKAFRDKVEAAWFDKLAAFQPQFIFFSAGFDGHSDDPLAALELTKEDYVWLTTEIAKIATVHCDGKMVSVLEGGYNLNALAQCAPAHVNAMVLD